MDQMVTLQEVTRESDRVKTLRFDLPQGFTFVPGQFVMLWTTKVLTPAGIPLRRAFSIASSPASDHLELCIALGSPTGLAHHLLMDAKAGDQFMLKGPHGKFVLSTPLQQETIFVAGGTGIAPIRSMLHSLNAEDLQQKVMLLFGMHSPKDYLYKEELQHLAKDKGITLHACCSRPDDTWDGNAGRVTDHFSHAVGSGDGKIVYMCGPSEMVKDILHIAQDLGFKPEDIHREQW